MYCDHCKANHHQHLCNFCNGHNAIIFNANLENMLQIIADKGLEDWLSNFCRISNENWENNVNLQNFLADPRINIGHFNGCDLNCLLLRLKWEAKQRHRF